MRLAGHDDALVEHLAHFAEDPVVGLAEGGDRPGLRADEADLDRPGRGTRRPGEERRARERAGRAGADKLHDLAAR